MKLLTMLALTLGFEPVGAEAPPSAFAEADSGQDTGGADDTGSGDDTGDPVDTGDSEVEDTGSTSTVSGAGAAELSGETGGCSCSSATPAHGLAGLGLLLGLIALRRRR